MVQGVAATLAFLTFRNSELPATFAFLTSRNPCDAPARKRESCTRQEKKNAVREFAQLNYGALDLMFLLAEIEWYR
jgi:hypothetical protein